MLISVEGPVKKETYKFAQTTMKMFVMTNLIRLLNHLHPAEHGHLRETNKVAKDFQHAEPTAHQQPQYEQQIKAVQRKITNRERQKRVFVLLAGSLFSVV